MKGKGVKGIVVFSSIILVLISLFIFSSNQKQNIKMKEYFKNAAEQKRLKDNMAVINLLTMIEDENLTPESRKSAVKTLRELLRSIEQEREIEERLHDRYKNGVLCYIESNRRCRIMFNDRRLSASKAKYIKDTIYNVSGITEIEVELKQ
jgi:hypothetical protein